MRKLLKWVAGLLGVFVLLVLALYALAWFKSERAMAKTYTVADPPLAIARDPAAIARGAHVFATRGCSECHGAGAEGKLVFDAGPVMKVVGPNITRGGQLMQMTPDQVGAAIRHGVGRDGHPLVFMPAEDFHEMSDEDTAALVAFLQSLPPSANRPPALEVRPLGRILYLFGEFPLLPAEKLDHSPRSRSAPAMGATADYGKYLAKGCSGCHGADFGGQHVPGTPPKFPDSQNLTPGNLGEWTQADFFRAIRDGTRPDGSKLDPFMPWQTYAKMTDIELGALWAYFRSLPPVQSKPRKD
ncbi:MAG: c-type cytochrome [Arenimonas sp.]